MRYLIKIILNNLNCIYDYGENVYNDTTNSFCSNTEYTMTGNSTPPSICTEILSGNDSLPGVTDSGSPLLQAYELTRFGQGENSVEYIDNIGKYVIQGVLIAIEGFTLISHVFYAIIFYRIYYNKCNCPPFGTCIWILFFLARCIDFLCNNF